MTGKQKTFRHHPLREIFNQFFTRWFIEIRSWDRTRIPLPFGRGGVAVGQPIYVKLDDNQQDLVQAQHEVETALNLAQQRADQLAGLQVTDR